MMGKQGTLDLESTGKDTEDGATNVTVAVRT